LLDIIDNNSLREKGLLILIGWAFIISLISLSIVNFVINARLISPSVTVQSNLFCSSTTSAILYPPSCSTLIDFSSEALGLNNIFFQSNINAVSTSKLGFSIPKLR